MVAAHHSPLRATAAFVGGSNITTTFRDPQRGHFNRLSRRDNGKSRPRVHTRSLRIEFFAVGALAGVGSVILLPMFTARANTPSLRKGVAYRFDDHKNKMGTKAGRSQATTAESEPFKVAFLRLFERRTTPR